MLTALVCWLTAVVLTAVVLTARLKTAGRVELGLALVLLVSAADANPVVARST